MPELATIVISSGGLISALVWLAIVLVILWGCWKLASLIPNAVVRQVLTVIVYVVGAVVVLNFLLSLVGVRVLNF
jgi:hypothetical protein